MIIRKWIFIAVSLVLPLLVSQASEADEIGDFDGQLWNVKVCNNCSTEQNFKDAASSYNVGKVTIFNLESGQIRTYSAEMGTTFGDVTHVPVPTPNEAYEALNEYEILKNDLIQMAPQPFNSQVSGPFGDVCGQEGTTFGTWIPDGAFEAACSVHDQCYASGDYSKMFCDDLFLKSLETTSIKLSRALSYNIFRQLLTQHLLLRVGDIYFYAVVNSEDAFNAYCGVDANANTAFCQAGHEANQLTLDGSEGVVGSPYSGGVTYSHGGITFRYEYRCVPTYVGSTDNYGEDSWVNQYCQFVLVSD